MGTQSGFVDRGAKHSPMCNVTYGEYDDPCNCELGALRKLAAAAGEIVCFRLLHTGDCHGDLEQALIVAHAEYAERVS